MISQLPFIVLRPHAGPLNAEVHGLACHMLVSMCLLVTNLKVHAKPEKQRPPTDMTDI
jgi:hypothetical protein